MRLDNKKPRSGQQRGKDGYLLGANNGRCSLPQYTHPSRNPKAFDVDAHIRAIRRASIDAYCLFKDWPSQVRYSYFIGSNGKLLCRSERSAAR